MTRLRFSKLILREKIIEHKLKTILREDYCIDVAPCQGFRNSVGAKKAIEGADGAGPWRGCLYRCATVAPWHRPTTTYLAKKHDFRKSAQARAEGASLERERERERPLPGPGVRAIEKGGVI